MKKILLRLLIAVFILLVVAVIALSLSLDGLVKRAIETYGPRLTKVDVKLNSASVSPLSGSGSLKGLVVGNPEGFKSPEAIRMGSISVGLKPASIFSDKVIVRKIEIIAPEITLEVSLGGNNLSKILANVNGTGTAPTNAPSSPSSSGGKKLQVDDFTITGAKVLVAVSELGGKSQTVSIPDLHFNNLGTGPEGITAGELLQRVLPVIVEEALKAASTAMPEINKMIGGFTQNLNQTASGGLSNLTRNLGHSGMVTNLTGVLGNRSASNVIPHNLNDLLKQK